MILHIMKMMNFQMFMILASSCLFQASFAKDERTLYNALFGADSEYTAAVRPKKSPTEVLDIYMEYELNQLHELDEKSQVMHTVGFLTAEWTDEYISWSPADYGGLENLIVPPYTVWLPDFGITNSAETFYQDGFDTDFRVVIHYDGNITWSFGGDFETTCLLDNTYYPLDLQACSIELKNWAYAGNQVDLHHKKTTVDIENYQQNGIWELTETETHKHSLVYASQPGEFYPVLEFELLLRRKANYYVLNILIPCGFVIIVALAVYWLPPDAGEKVSFGVTVLLAFSVFQLVIAEQTPHNSDYTPKLSVLVISIMGLTSFSVLISILILYLHYKNTATRVPKWLRILFLKGCATIMCMRSSMPEMTDDDIKSESVYAETEFANGSGNGPPDSQSSPGKGELREILACLRFMTKRMKTKDKENTILAEWRALGKVIDRILFWLSFIAIAIICGLLLSVPDPAHTPQ